MKLELLDINKFIKEKNIKQVSTIRLYEKIEKTDPQGLYSEEIFGKFGSSERRKTFAYIDLKVKIIHPEAFTIITGLNTNISKLILNKAKYIISSDGSLIEDSKKGQSGIAYFVSIFNQIDIDKFEHNKSKNVQFIKNNMDKIFIDKFLVLPAGIRDLSIAKTSKKTVVSFSDLSELYTSLIRHTHILGTNPELLPEDIFRSIVEHIQKNVLEITDWIKKRLEGKNGLIRSGLLRKAIDYSGRLVATTDHTLPLGTIGLPWQVILKLYEPFAINYILKKDATMVKSIQYMLKSEKPIDSSDLRNLFAIAINNTEFIPKDMVEYFMYVAEEISKDKTILYKRDPVENRDSWLAADIKIKKEGMTLSLNPFDLDRTGGDHDGDAYAVAALFTKEAQKEAKEKLHPKYTKSMWTAVTSANKCPYSITLDAMTAIYAATK